MSGRLTMPITVSSSPQRVCGEHHTSPLTGRPAPIAEQAPSAVARSSASAQAFASAQLYAPAQTPVVLVGETGTGKSYLADYLHGLSPRRDGPFVDRTAAEITESLAAAQLFGYERGAFTGAFERTQGLFAESDGGTLLLDDLHRMSITVQGLLLRALSREVYRPLGAARDYPLRCRLVYAMNEDPDRLVAHEVLLPDLRYRLGRCVIRLAPLAERQEEIGPFAVDFLKRCPRETGVPGPTRFATDVIPALERAAWPGNLRSLKGAVERAYLHAQREPEVRLAHFDEDVLAGAAGATFRRHGDPAANRHAVELALRLSEGSHTDAARLLHVSRHTIHSYAAAAPEISPEI
jgi:DNA-binding NtrC family response regulator